MACSLGLLKHGEPWWTNTKKDKIIFLNNRGIILWIYFLNILEIRSLSGHEQTSASTITITLMYILYEMSILYLDIFMVKLLNKSNLDTVAGTQIFQNRIDLTSGRGCRTLRGLCILDLGNNRNRFLWKRKVENRCFQQRRAFLKLSFGSNLSRKMIPGRMFSVCREPNKLTSLLILRGRMITIYIENNKFQVHFQY